MIIVESALQHVGPKGVEVGLAHDVKGLSTVTLVHMLTDKYDYLSVFRFGMLTEQSGRNEQVWSEEQYKPKLYIFVSGFLKCWICVSVVSLFSQLLSSKAPVRLSNCNKSFAFSNFNLD